MAKVSPLVTSNKARYYWTTRLSKLVESIGQEVMYQCEDGTSNTALHVTRRGITLVCEAKWLRGNRLKTTVKIQSNKGYFHYISNGKKFEENTTEPANHKTGYKLLERVVYSHLSPTLASEIVTRADLEYALSPIDK